MAEFVLTVSDYPGEDGAEVTRTLKFEIAEGNYTPAEMADAELEADAFVHRLLERSERVEKAGLVKLVQL